jgi:starch synthase (maltosyl-transferring)
MPDQNGRKRVVITHLQPCVEAGAFPAKVLINKPVTVSADIFTDGHDDIAASLLYKHESERPWKEVPLALINNDRWEASFTPTQFGQYLFTVQAWIDHFTTWKKGLIKKKAAGQGIGVELLIGAEILEGINTKDKKSKALLADWVRRLREEGTDEEALIDMISGDDVAAVVRQCADKTLATKHSQSYRLDIEREKAGFSTWYELFPRSASAEPGRHGTFKDVKELLPRVAEMGFDVLYFPPIHPIGRVKRKGRNNALDATENDPGSPWAIGNELGGHKAIHPELGTLKDFKDLINAAKKQGIEIAMDIAFQCAPDHPWVKEHPQWFRWRPDGSVQYAENPPKKYEDILPLNFETEDWEALWQELKSVFDYWIGQGVSIFRVDNPHTKSFHFWEWVIPAIRKEHPEAIFLAEAFTRPRLMERLARAGFTQSYTYFTWRQSKRELEEYLTELTQTEKRWYMRPNFWPNTPDILHEELVHGGENKHLIRLILAATLSSNYGVYGPVYEFGINEPFPGKEEYIDNEKYEIKHWDWKHLSRIGEVMARINRIRKENPALQDTNNIEFAHTTNEQIICCVKHDDETGNTLIISVNLDPWNTQAGMVNIPPSTPGMEHGSFRVKDLLSGDTYTWQRGENYVQLNPHEMPAHVFLVE